jgi:hypothetical protein
MYQISSGEVSRESAYFDTPSLKYCLMTLSKVGWGLEGNFLSRPDVLNKSVSTMLALLNDETRQITWEFDDRTICSHF